MNAIEANLHCTLYNFTRIYVSYFCNSIKTKTLMVKFPQNRLFFFFLLVLAFFMYQNLLYLIFHGHSYYNVIRYQKSLNSCGYFLDVAGFLLQASDHAISQWQRVQRHKEFCHFAATSNATGLIQNIIKISNASHGILDYCVDSPMTAIL